MSALYRLDSDSLPRLDFTGRHDEQGMGRYFPKSANLTIPFRITLPQLGLQMGELKIKLALRYGQPHGLSFSGDLGSIEGISSLPGLVMDYPEIG